MNTLHQGATPSKPEVRPRSPIPGSTGTEAHPAKRRKLERVDSIDIEAHPPGQPGHGHDSLHPITVDDGASLYTDRATTLSNMSANGRVRPAVSEYRSTEKKVASARAPKRRHRQQTKRNHDVSGDSIEDSHDDNSSSSGAHLTTLGTRHGGSAGASHGHPEHPSTTATRPRPPVKPSLVSSSPYFLAPYAQTTVEKTAGVKRRSCDDVDELSNDLDGMRPSKASQRSRVLGGRLGASPGSLALRGDTSPPAFPAKVDTGILGPGLRVQAAVGTPSFIFRAAGDHEELESAACILKPKDLSTILVPTSVKDGKLVADLEWVKVNLKKVSRIQHNPLSDLIVIKQSASNQAPVPPLLIIQFTFASDALKLVDWAQSARKLEGVDINMPLASP